MSRYRAMFDRLAARREGAFVPFAMLGDPDVRGSLAVVDALVRGGADALELGIPYSDPIADGPVIQAAASRALDHGASAESCWAMLAELRGTYPDLPIGILTYAHPIVRAGTDAYYAAAAVAGVDSVLVADAPSTERAPFVAAARRAGVDPVLVVPRDIDDARLRAIARDCGGYTYVLGRAGVTGATPGMELSHRDLFERLRALGAPPALVGFGISTPAQVRRVLADGAAGAISGSAVVARMAEGLRGGIAAACAAVESFAREMKAATRG